jgi:hypothetical protein
MGNKSSSHRSNGTGGVQQINNTNNNSNPVRRANSQQWAGNPYASTGGNVNASVAIPILEIFRKYIFANY